MALAAATATCSVLFLAHAPHAIAGPLRAADLQAVSAGNPFPPECGLFIPPPFTDSDFKPRDTATEPHTAVNPRDPQNIVAAWIQDFSFSHIVATTKDGGRSWRRVLVPGIGKCTGGDYARLSTPG